MTEQKLKHLEFIQGVVNRLSTNSFLLKGWTVVLISALFILGAQNSNPVFIWLAYFPGVVFWLLDGYYLCLERRYRSLYDDVRVKDDDIDFNLKTDQYATEERWLANVGRPAVLGFHVPLLIVIFVVALLS